MLLSYKKKRGGDLFTLLLLLDQIHSSVTLSNIIDLPSLDTSPIASFTYPVVQFFGSFVVIFGKVFFYNIKYTILRHEHCFRAVSGNIDFSKSIIAL